MHRGRYYPQVIDRMLSPNCVHPFYAPLNLFVQATISYTGVGTDIVRVRCDYDSTDYTGLRIVWKGDFNFHLVPMHVVVTQTIDTFTKPGMEWRVNFRDFTPATSNNLVTWQNLYQWFPMLTTTLPWVNYSNTGLFIFSQVGLLEPVRYF